ncbi:hypothetical protein BDW72DRAFT_214135 [Aspergillus terricola var. indicus]
MIDPLSAAGLAYPIAKDLYYYAKCLRQACREIQHAKNSLKKVINKAELVAETYMLFSNTMASAKKNQNLAKTFKRQPKLMRNVRSESTRIIKKLWEIIEVFSPLLQKYPINPVQRWIMQFQWYRKEKNAVVPLLMEMQFLQGSMDIIATLVNIQMLQHSDRRAESGRDSIQVQIKSTEIGLMRLQEDKRVQEEMLKQRSVTAKQNDSADYFAQEVIRILKREIPKLHRNQPPGRPWTPDFGPSSSSSAPRQQVPRTPPPLLSRPDDGGHETPPLSHYLVEVGDESATEKGMEDAHPQQGPYVQMPPFGPPEAGLRPRPGRNSLAHLPPSSSEGDQSAEGRAPYPSKCYLEERNRNSYSTDKRQTGSRISVYGNEGEFTHTHLTGSAGLPPGWQRHKGES